ncbi:hypothetical protein CS022_03260 [Veronia nyctiphanis]|uniref:EAL domain-containing protein n=1 Tax=Veronia nyctiphanis TaxID=1278244 RepID=A0A4Q0YTN6_9GAMM|nr:EAL domain-containing protein [Veronia nyctiphanis]RXJ74600.1 hypothetical protein CS022_03260 [Veronia nyctiphanis]
MNLSLKRKTAFVAVFMSIFLGFAAYLPISQWVADRNLTSMKSSLSSQLLGLDYSTLQKFLAITSPLSTCNDNTLKVLEMIASTYPSVKHADFTPNGSPSCVSGREKKINRSSGDSIVTFASPTVIWFVFQQQVREIELNSNNGTLSLTVQLTRPIMDGCEDCLSAEVKVKDNAINLISVRQDEQKHQYRFHYTDNIEVSVFYTDEARFQFVGFTPMYLALILTMSCMLIIMFITLSQSDSSILQNLIIEAIDKRALKPFYQPIVVPEGNGYRIVGAEVLLRWITQSGNVILPNSFIPLAEQDGLIDKITEQLINNVLKQLSSIELSPHFFASVNIPPAYLEKTKVAEKLLRKISKSGLDYRVISLEVTERTPFENIEKAAKTIETLRDEGMSIKLDDCGMGYGAFSYLQSLNIDTIKIDHMFVKTIGFESSNTSILDAIIAFAQTSDLSIVAEGVENKRQADYLVNAGVEMLQGDFFGEPMSFGEFKLLLERGSFISREN